MLPKGTKVKISENKKAGNTLAPRFQIHYTLNGIQEELLRKLSFEIVSLLKKDGDLLIEVNSSLLLLPDDQREECVIELVKAVKALGLEYRYKKSVSQNKGSFFSQALNRGSDYVHEVMIHVPPHLWSKEGLHSLLPTHGVRYHICKAGTDAVKLLDNIHQGQLLDEEKAEFIEYVIFDCCKNGQMGLFSETLDQTELKALLT